jgi:ribosomal protein S18 acetylase RimI-like enzyme
MNFAPDVGRSGAKEEAMGSLTTLTSPCVHRSKPNSISLPEMQDILQLAPLPCWDRQRCLVALQSDGAGVAVAENDDGVIGFALYRGPPDSPAARLHHTVQRLLWHLSCNRAAPFAAPESELLWIGVHPDWNRQGIGSALLLAIHQELDPFGGCIRATVPETNLPAQLLLRDAGYRAIRIVPSRFVNEDGYLMERKSG